MSETMTTRAVMTADVRDWLMETPRFPVMATIGRDGMPSQSVIWFDLFPDNNDVVLLNTRAGRVKEKHLRRDARLSLCFEEGNDYVTLEGRAELVDDLDRSLEDIKRLARRYGDDPETFNGQHRVTILMHVERVIRHT